MLTLILLTATLTVSVPEPQRSQNPCASGAARVETLKSAIGRAFSIEGASAVLAAKSLPYKPTSGAIALVADTLVCTAAAYNGAWTPAASFSEAYVFSVSPTRFVVVTERQSDLLFMVFKDNWEFLLAWQG